jgi:hypothetical protein
MRMPNHDSQQDCRVIPFVRPVVSEDTVLTSSIAAVIAVTILHRKGESPEERLLDIIDASGEAEVLDITDVLEEYETVGAAPKPSSRPDNDNGIMALL